MKTQLSNREFQAVELTALGQSQKEAADWMELSTHTIDQLIRRAKTKLGIQKNTELSAWYFATKYHITIDYSPVKRRIVAVVMLAITLFSMLADDFDYMRASRLGKTKTRTETARASRSRSRRNEYYYDNHLKIA